MEKHTIDIEEREHQQEECIDSEPDTVQSELPPPQTSSNQPTPPTEEEEEQQPCIFRVHKGLRHVNGKAYTPVLVSIGPYHRGRRELLPMEKHKKRYLKLLLQRNNQREKDYLDSMRRLEKRARKCYANPVDHLNSEQFVRMMLNDACFVIEFLLSLHKFLFTQELLLSMEEYLLFFFQRELGQQLPSVGDDPNVKVTWMRSQICSDLMLLENQLPFFVLSEFYGMSHRIRTQTSENLPTLEELAECPIILMLPNSDISEIQDADFDKSKHFLDLVHKVCHPHPTNNAEHSSTGFGPCLKMPCVIELAEAGVTFKLNAEHSSTGSNWGSGFKMPCVQKVGVTLEEREFSMFDIDFENGHFKIPKIKVTNLTETFFRNIIAYEQHSLDDEPKYFSDYTYFMDLLINSKEDVSQLRRHKIIETMLGDDKEVAVMFNKLGNGRFILRKFYYSQLCSKVNDHCDKRWNRVVAALKHDYFKNIWVTVATFAAAFLLLFTLTQTVIALITIISSFPSPR